MKCQIQFSKKKVIIIIKNRINVLSAEVAKRVVNFNCCLKNYVLYVLL